MKNRRNAFLFVIAVSVFMFYSCEKTDAVDNTTDSLASEIIGIYSGTLENSSTNQSREATLTVTMQNDSLILMHCVAGSFDSTIIMQLYQNHDSVMVCHTGQDFYNEYGHLTNNYDFCFSRQMGWTNNNWMNNNCCMGNNNTNWGNMQWAGNEQWNAWTNHLNTQHNQNDRHYGGFNLTMKSCHYQYSLINGNTGYFEIFKGVKSNN